METAQWIEAWEVQQRINIRLLDMVGEENLKDSYASRARDVSKVFSHIHNTRIMWLEATGMLPEGVRKIDKGALTRLDAIKSALEGSSQGIVELLRKAGDKGKVAGFKKSPAMFLTYLVAHESHHRGQIIAALRVCGHALKEDEIYSLWDWDKL